MALVSPVYRTAGWSQSGTWHDQSHQTHSLEGGPSRVWHWGYFSSSPRQPLTPNSMAIPGLLGWPTSTELLSMLSLVLAFFPPSACASHPSSAQLCSGGFHEQGTQSHLQRSVGAQEAAFLREPQPKPPTCPLPRHCSQQAPSHSLFSSPFPHLPGAVHVATVGARAQGRRGHHSAGIFLCALCA